jgi:signal transduction histidine kinase
VHCKSPFLGNIYLSEKLDGAPFSADDEETLERFAVQASIAIDNAHLHAQAAEIATALERLRIAHEMHDGLAQVLGYVNTKVQAADQYLRRGKTEEASLQLQQLAVSARQAYGDVREAIVGLRTLPGRDRTLADVLEEFLQHWREQSGVAAELSMDPALRLPTNVELQLVRVIQESLTNVRKHARATTVRVSVEVHEGQLVVTISDDGRGFDPASVTRGEFPRLGLTTMRERAASVGAQLDVESAPARGTSVRFTMPLAS